MGISTKTTWTTSMLTIKGTGGWLINTLYQGIITTMKTRRGMSRFY
jgi:hypothetical protein